MMVVPARYGEVLKAICDLPTAPFCEEHVARWLEAWAREVGLRSWRDAAGNLYGEYLRGERSETPLVVEAHMDHPGFLVVGMEEGEAGMIVRAEFRGGVKPSYFPGALVRFWIAGEGRWAAAKVLEMKARESGRAMDVWLKCQEAVAAGTLGMWDLPDARVEDRVFRARVCDDLAGCAAMVCLVEELLKQEVAGHVIMLFSRAEEVGFAGVIAVCEKGWIPKGSRIIGLEMSKAGFKAMQGKGPVVRVGDRTGIFSPGLTHFLTQAAGYIQDDEPGFPYQRALMDGGMCSTTAFVAWGYDAAAMCLPLEGYHNMREVHPGLTAKLQLNESNEIISESIHLSDFAGMVRVLVEAVKRMEKYQPGFGVMRERLTKMHAEEQEEMLYGTMKRMGAEL
jgi:putative aminopeptidase FrvX